MLLYDFVKDLRSSFQFQNLDRTTVKFKSSDLKILIPYFNRHIGKFIFAFSCMLFVSLLALPAPYLTKIIIDDAIGQKNFNLLVTIIAIMVVVMFFRSGLSTIMSYVFTLLNQKILLSLKGNLFNKVIRLPFSFFDKHQSSYLTSRIHEVSGVSTFFSSSTLNLIIRVMEFVFSLIILFAFAFKLTLVILLILPVYYFIVQYFRKGLRVYSKNVMETGAQINRSMQESLAGIDVVKSFGTEERETHKLSGRLNNLFSCLIHLGFRLN